LRLAAVTQNRADSASIMRDLAEDGFIYESLRDLRVSRIPYRAAVPTLMKWLRRTSNYDIKEEIVRALSVPWAGPEAMQHLVDEFRSAPQSQNSYKWAVANGLAVVASDDAFEAIAELVQDRRHGTSRQMLAVALGNMRNPHAPGVLMELLKDEEVNGHAIIGLGKLRATAARIYIEPFLKHGKSWIRNEAKKAIARIDRAAVKRTNKSSSRRLQ